MGMFQVLKDIITKVTGRRDITIDTDFIKDLKLNSFDIVNIVCAIEEKYNAEIPTRDLRKLRTVRDAVEYLAKRGIA
jgi:acyl carrier protein